MNKTALLTILLFASAAFGDPSQYFKIKVIDEQTGRGVPLVELRTTGAVKYFTDSNGLVAFYEPGLMDQKIWFWLSSHGYEFPADAFGSRGTTLQIKPGGSAELKIKRINIAERLYRITGEGIYRDSVLLGEKVPTSQPTLNSQVTGQDSVIALPYRDKIHWYWGDTGKLSYALGLFATSGATSLMPDKGGLDPSIGVDLNYFVDASGFSRAIAPIGEPGAVWIGGITTIPDDKGEEKLVGRYTRIKDLGTRLAQGLIIYDDDKDVFRELKRIGIDEKIAPNGQPIIKDGYLYFPAPFPTLRVKRNLTDFADLTKYEAFTLDDGKFVWKRGATPVSQKDKNHEPIDLHDVDTGKPVVAHGGTVAWNDFRKKWIMLFVEAGGTSFLGEMWFAESENLEGPWTKAKKVATHNKYDFYNPAHHPFFDQQGGKIIYFEGTYTNTFSGNPEATPRYEYNQIMYRLDLSDPRLKF